MSSREKSARLAAQETARGLTVSTCRIVVIGGDVSPIDVVTHIPVLCEDNDIPYVFVPSRQELGLAAATKRATTLVLIRVPAAGSAYAKDYESIFKTVANLKATVM